MLSRLVGGALSIALLSACMGIPVSLPNSAPDGAAAVTPSPTGLPSPGAPAASAAPTPRPKLQPIAGVWRVRKVLSPAQRSVLVPGAAFQDEAFYITAGCDMEPCPTIEVKMTPLGRSSPVAKAALRLEGDRYVSAAKAENEGPCLNKDGDRVQGGATVTSTIQLWAADVRAAGTAVESTALLGSIDMHLAPTSIGSAAGCEPQTASYDLTGRPAQVATRNVEPPIPNEKPNTAGGLANLPALSIKVSGVKIVYFPIEGDTLNELGASMANGGLRACGPINYEWHEGDDRPVACAITGFNDVDAAIDQRTDPSTGACSISAASIKARFTIQFPRWTAPRRVPARLLAWWRKVVVFIRDHEAGHIAISRNYVKKLNARLVGAGCLEADAIITKWAKQLNSAQEEYDRREYSKPWPVPPYGY
jgi:predicted secreted Zn-dependent protease